MKSILAKSLAVVAALGLAATAARAGAEEGAISAKELSDREEIRTLLLKYGRYLDDRELRKYAELFAEDGQWLAGPYSPTGPDEIYALMSSLFEDRKPSLPGQRNYHIMSNMMIEVDGDRATAWSHYTFFMPGPDNKPEAFSSGTYDDELVRVDGEWKFYRRRLTANVAPSPEHGGQ